MSSLSIFLAGFRMAATELGATDAKPEFSGFDDWVARKLGFRESTAGWANMILAVTLGLDPDSIRWESYDRDASSVEHEESLRRFFALVDEYRAGAVGLHVRGAHSPGA